jgi:hypothetical protein
MAGNKAAEVEATQLALLKAIQGSVQSVGSREAVLYWARAYALLEGTIKPTSAYENDGLTSV